MQDFIATYGIWLLVALAIVIALAFLLKSKGKSSGQLPAMPSAEPALPEESLAPTPLPALPVEAPSPAPETAFASAPADAAPASIGEPDNLLQLKGVGPKVNAILIGLGVTRFDQIAAWTPEDIARIDPHLGNFSGRIVRDQWVDQASYLARGDKAGFEAKYGKL